MAKFKVGDRVRCVDARWPAEGILAQGKVYAVVDGGECPDGHVRLDVDEGGFAWDGARFELVEQPMAAKDTQVGGDHYKTMPVQPWAALEAWMTREQVIGYYLGTAISYLARVNVDKPGKGGVQDVRKGAHVLQQLAEFMEK